MGTFGGDEVEGGGVKGLDEVGKLGVVKRRDEANELNKLNELGEVREVGRLGELGWVDEVGELDGLEVLEVEGMEEMETPDELGGHKPMTEPEHVVCGHSGTTHTGFGTPEQSGSRLFMLVWSEAMSIHLSNS